MLFRKAETMDPHGDMRRHARVGDGDSLRRQLDRSVECAQTHSNRERVLCRFEMIAANTIENRSGVDRTGIFGGANDGNMAMTETANDRFECAGDFNSVS
jgi:hypothetical protein